MIAKVYLSTENNELSSKVCNFIYAKIVSSKQVKERFRGNLKTNIYYKVEQIDFVPDKVDKYLEGCFTSFIGGVTPMKRVMPNLTCVA